MSAVDHEHGPDCGDPRSMDFLDKYLTVWIFLAMSIGVGFGYVAPWVVDPIQEYHLVEVGLIAMMYPRSRRSTTDSSRRCSARGACSASASSRTG